MLYSSHLIICTMSCIPTSIYNNVHAFFLDTHTISPEKIWKLEQSVTRINSGNYTVLLVHNEIMIVLVSIPPCPKVFRKYCVKKKCTNKEIYNDKYRHTRDILFGLLSK
jgi:hypothetical protein